jgi:hypothetical protein
MSNNSFYGKLIKKNGKIEGVYAWGNMLNIIDLKKMRRVVNATRFFIH